MPVELEDQIMREIGLAQHYSWFNGGSCEHTRKTAASRLANVINRHATEGDAIAEPNQELIEHLICVSTYGESSPYFLTNTWKAASDIIQIHMRAYLSEDKEKVFSNALSSIKQCYPAKNPFTRRYR